MCRKNGSIQFQCALELIEGLPWLSELLRIKPSSFNETSELWLSCNALEMNSSASAKRSMLISETAEEFNAATCFGSLFNTILKRRSASMKF